MKKHRYIDFLKPQISNEDVRILLWDIDGTLLRSRKSGAYKLYFSAALEKTFGKAGNFNNVNAAGNTDIQIAFQALEHEGFSVEQISARMPEFIGHLGVEMQKYIDANENVYEILPGVREILEAVSKIPKFKYALLTGNVSIGAKLKLEYAGIWDYFAQLPNVFGEISHNRRELPAAAEKLFFERFNYHFKPEQFIVIGDTPVDIDCARYFGAKIVCVETGRGVDRQKLAAEKPDALVKDLSNTADILKILEDL